MPLVLNGKPHPLTAATTLEALLVQLGYEPKSVAVAVDGAFLPRSQYATFQLSADSENQALEILSPMQGG